MAGIENYFKPWSTEDLRSFDAFASGNEAIQLAACMAHITRKFYHAHKVLKQTAPKDKPKTQGILDLIGQLYRIEEEIKE